MGTRGDLFACMHECLLACLVVWCAVAFTAVWLLPPSCCSPVAGCSTETTWPTPSSASQHTHTHTYPQCVRCGPPHFSSLHCQGGVPMPPWVLDSSLSHATKRQLQFMYDVGVLAPFMLDVACVQQLEKLDEGEAAYALDELGKALSDRVRLRNPTGFFIRICQRLRATRRDRDQPPQLGGGAAGGGLLEPGGGGGAAAGPVSFAEREREREREREQREREQRAAGSGDRDRDGFSTPAGPPGPGGGAGGGGSGTPGRGGGSSSQRGSSPPPYALPGLRPVRSIGRGGAGGPGLGPDDHTDHMGPGGDGGGFGPRGRRGRSSSRSPPPRRPGGMGGPGDGRGGYWGPPGGCLGRVMLIGGSWGLAEGALAGYHVSVLPLADVTRSESSEDGGGCLCWCMCWMDV